MSTTESAATTESDLTEVDFAPGATALDRYASGSLWMQLEAELRGRIERGDFDQRFPTDHELMEIYGVSRHTVRHAISSLDTQGLVTRRRGVGSEVNKSRFEQTLGSLYSLFQVVEAAGVEQRSVVLALEVTTNPVAAQHLDCAPDTQLVYLARQRLAGDQPLALDRIWMPAALAAPLLEVDFSHTALYRELERATGQRPRAGWERITPSVVHGQDAQLLGVEPGAAVFSLERLGICQICPLEWRVTLIRGDRFSFVADWSTGRHSDLRFETTAC
jgi:GntR family transcriptional regulator